MFKYKIGMYGGSFDPLHIGHVNCIIQAANQCERLYVILSVSKNNYIPHQERFRWLKQITKDMEHVDVIKIFDHSESKMEYDWEAGAEDIKQTIGQKIDVVFAGDDYAQTDIYKRNYPDSDIIYISRDAIGISSTEIRKNPYILWNYLPKEVQPYFVKKVLIVGTESCGKSTIVRNMAKNYNTSYVEEKGRDVCEFAGGIDNMIPSDFIEILYKHKVSEMEEIRKANKLLFIDTDAVVTNYYLKLQCEDEFDIHNIKKLAESIALLNEYDLVFYLEPDVDWVQDGTRTYGEPDVRDRNNSMLKQVFERAGTNFISISGDYQDRFTQITNHINKLFQTDYNNKYYNCHKCKYSRNQNTCMNCNGIDKYSNKINWCFD